ncbi:cation:proton antiporter regulatory subunit [Natronosalvus vescus]|uniref:cation:proton antiporter regulatory subunit n=1 Tax=Natronosalvus vescus TaxID=2953881 RepID=UPI002091D0B3|nr:TrkA C-terminal domain-containing protein [Natronosalvus vescus]
MPFEVKETILPGIGKRYELYLDPHQSLAVVIRPSGERQLFYREHTNNDYEEIVELTDAQARAFGLFLVGAYYQPIAGQLTEQSSSGELIQWYSVTEDSGLAGVREDEVVIEAKTDTTLLGLEREGEVRSVIENNVVFEVGDRLIVIGTPEAHDELESLLERIS